nr:MAG TPA: hypothetical protein [Caudoviricetes sp.]
MARAVISRVQVNTTDSGLVRFLWTFRSFDFNIVECL